MNIEQWYRIIRSAAQITGKTEFIVIGTQAIQGWYPEFEDTSVCASKDVDLEPLGATEEMRNEIRGSLGEETIFFHNNSGAYADAVEVDLLATLPHGWRDRLKRVEAASLITPSGVQAVALCLHPNDIVISKLMAHRPKDFIYCSKLVALRIPELDEFSIIAGLREVADRVPHLAKRALDSEVFIKNEFSLLRSHENQISQQDPFERGR